MERSLQTKHSQNSEMITFIKWHEVNSTYSWKNEPVSKSAYSEWTICMVCHGRKTNVVI